MKFTLTAAAAAAALASASALGSSVWYQRFDNSECNGEGTAVEITLGVCRSATCYSGKPECSVMWTAVSENSVRKQFFTEDTWCSGAFQEVSYQCETCVPHAGYGEEVACTNPEEAQPSAAPTPSPAAPSPEPSPEAQEEDDVDADADADADVDVDEDGVDAEADASVEVTDGVSRAGAVAGLAGATAAFAAIMAM